MSDAEQSNEPIATPRGQAALLGPVEVRALAEEFGVRPTKQLGQNFVHDANTVRRIVTTAGVTRDDVVLEVGPGLGSLTMALMDVVDRSSNAGRRTRCTGIRNHDAVSAGTIRRRHSAR